MRSVDQAAASIRILTTLYNARSYIPHCIESIKRQSVVEWSCSITDDLSTDGSADLADALTRGDPRFEVMRNRQKRFQIGNYQQILARREVCDEDIIVMLDGDDWFPDTHVLERVLAAYADERIWLTWGSYLSWFGKGRPITRHGKPLTTDTASIRQHGWVTSHLRTCKAFLWRAIREPDLRAPSGNFWEVAGDLAFMIPMIEMAGNNHCRFLPEVNYIYNKENPLRDVEIHTALQQHYDQLIRSMPAYPLLTK